MERGWITGSFIPGPDWLSVAGSVVRPVMLHPTKEAALADPNQAWDVVVAHVERQSQSAFKIIGEWEVRAQPTTCQLCEHRIHYVREMTHAINGEIRPGWETAVRGQWKCSGRPRHEHENYGHHPRAWEGQ